MLFILKISYILLSVMIYYNFLGLIIFVFLCIMIIGDFMFSISLVISLVCMIVDQIIKMAVMGNMTTYYSINVIENFFSLTYVENDGAAWSILSGNRFFLILISIVAIILIYGYLIKNKNIKRFEFVCYSILIGGILGNLMDRIKFGFVVDYLDFKFFGYNFPIFNFADICIVISVILLLICGIKEDIKCKKLK